MIYEPIIFTVEEENLACIYDTSSRLNLISDISGAMPDFDEPEISDIAASVLSKLESMTDMDYAALTFHPAYHGDEEMEE